MFILLATEVAPPTNRKLRAGFRVLKIGGSQGGLGPGSRDLVFCPVAPGKVRGMWSLAQPASQEVILQSCLVQRRSIADPRTI